MNEGVTAKDKVIHSIVLSVGPDPSPRALNKLFELMNYSTEDRSEVLVLIDRAKLHYNDLSKNYVAFGDLLVKDNCFFLYLFIFSGFVMVSSFISFPIIFGFVAAAITVFILTFRYPNLRPRSKKAIWRRAVEESS